MLWTNEKRNNLAHYISAMDSLEGRRQTIAQMGLAHGVEFMEDLKKRIAQIWIETHASENKNRST